ncbi:hypothetical protein Acsp04_03500 [Actinomadura sp. NBRC 104425]|nr:hypothetical protein Acsp04_03500 [Actinomadura sp. NBRC 104425]
MIHRRVSLSQSGSQGVHGQKTLSRFSESGAGLSQSGAGLSQSGAGLSQSGAGRDMPVTLRHGAGAYGFAG